MSVKVYKWSLTDSAVCDCSQQQSTNHIVDVMLVNKMWRQIAIIPRSWRQCTQLAGNNSDSST